MERIRTGLEQDGEARSREALLQIIRHAPCGILAVRGDGRIAIANRIAHTIFAVPEPGLVGTPVDDLVPDALRGGHAALRSGYAARPEPRPMGAGRVVHGRRRDGSLVPLEIGLAPVDLPDGPAILATIVDIGDRLRAEQLAADQQATGRTLSARHADELRQLLDGLPQLVWTCAPDGPCTYLSPQWIAYTGVPENLHLGYGWLDAVHPGDRQPTIAAWQAAVAVSGPFQVDFRIRRHDGAYRWFHTKALPITGPSGEVVRWVGSNTDMQEIIELREQARVAAVAKSEFLAAMSHEIRTPMNGVLGMLGLLDGMELPREAGDLVGMARTSAEALLGIINDILDFSRIEAGRLAVDHCAFDLWREVEGVVRGLSIQAAGKGIDLAYRIAGTVPGRAVGDPARLRQILVNLLGNAIKFTERGSVALEVDARPEGEGVRATFTVTDSGIGIPEDRLADLFQPFVQIDAGITRRFGGSGLGLTISQRLAGLMGGGITVRSRPGEGSVFTLGLPLGTASPVHDQPRFHPIQGLRALVVCAHPVTAGWLGDLLAAWSVPATVVADLPGALRAAAGDGRPDVVILDRMLDPATEIALAAVTGGLRDPLVIQLRPLLVPDPAPGEDRRHVLATPVRRSDLYNLLVAHAQGAPRPPVPDPPAYGRIPGRALVVDDNEINRHFLCRLLARMGMDAEVAVHGEEALARLASAPYDLVFMDMQMPVMDGLACTRRIRSGEHPGVPAGIPIIALTANALASDQARCLAAGMDGYLSKPVSFAALWQTLCVHHPAGRHADPEPVPGPAVLCDRDRLVGTLQGDQETADRLVAMFAATLPSAVAGMEEALVRGDHVRVATLAHQLAGSAATVCCQRIHEAARRIEAADPVRPEGLHPLVADLRALAAVFVPPTG
jgi:PAS domain S-box-containing protein